MNIEIKDFEDLEGNVQNALIADPLSKEELMRLGVAVGRLITMNVQDNANRMAIIKQLYATAVWQIANDNGGFISESDEATADLMIREYIREMEEKNRYEEILLK